MIRRAAYAGLVALLGAAPALADIVSSPIPRPRPFVILSSPPPAAAPRRALVPVTPEMLSQLPEARPRSPAPVTASVSPRPPQAIIQGRSGSVCGVRSIEGVALPPIPGRIAGCGVETPVRVTAVSGVRLSNPATMDCGTAKALNVWVEKGAKPALRRTGGGLVALKVAASYSCRTRNNQPGAKISEHGRGRAIDISGFYLADGTLITVLDGWKARATAKPLKAMHKAACGPFGTVLGPNSDAYHRDHFHFDTARYRSGSYCR